MTPYVALLRAVNVGGTGKLPMTELSAMCEAAGFARVRTYIASGNVVFTSALDEAGVKAALEARLAATVAIFLDDPPSADALDHVRHQAGERLALGRREVYVAYGPGMGRSRLAIPAARHGTARNLNTVAELAALARAVR